MESDLGQLVCVFYFLVFAVFRVIYLVVHILQRCGLVRG